MLDSVAAISRVGGESRPIRTRFQILPSTIRQVCRRRCVSPGVCVRVCVCEWKRRDENDYGDGHPSCRKCKKKTR